MQVACIHARCACRLPTTDRNVSGKGRGVVATAEIQPGDLLMICEPLAFLRGPDGQRPQGETLIDKVRLNVPNNEIMS